ncbi:MAG: hypothetical protein ACIARR_05640 [Phycisphaerales bacterium JB059]
MTQTRPRPLPLATPLAGGLLLLVLTPALIWPLARAAFEVARGLAAPDHADLPAAAPIAMATGRSLLAAVGIALLATLAAAPAARLIARGRARWAPLLFTPMLMPSYLAYAGWGLARAPGSALGDALERAAASGARWAPVLTGRSLAILALALWAFPLASIVLGASIARRDPALDDLLRLDAPSPLARLRVALALHRSALLSSVALITLVMLGSSVPLHLAQIDTLAIVIWRELSESPRDAWWRAWVSATPLLLFALLGAWVIGARLVRAAHAPRNDPPRDDAHRAPSLRVITLAVLVWLLAVGGPLLLFALSIRSPDSLWRFWRLSAAGVAHTLLGALAVTLLTLLIALALSLILSTGSRAGARFSVFIVRLLLLGALAPGVLIGAALVEAFPRLDPAALPPLAGVARFGFLGAVGACLGAWSEPPERRDARRLTAVGPRAWALACLPPQAPLLLGLSLAAGLMSLHEIEASVIVQPPGRASLAQQILGYLHFSRMEDMSAAGLWLVGGGVVLASCSVALIALTFRIRARSVQP